MNYTHRAFGFQDDVLNGFRGLENLLQPTLTEDFHWGLPTSMFDAAVSWRFPYHYPDRRRTQFPSWSWAGWNLTKIWAGYMIGHPHQKTVGRAVLWHKVSGDPLCRTIMDSSQPGFALKAVSPHVVGDIGFTAPSNRESTITALMSFRVVCPQPAHLLQFWTSSALLTVDRTESGSKRTYNISWYTWMDEKQNNILLDIRGKDDRVMGQISLNRDWRPLKPDSLEFIVISRFVPYAYDNQHNGSEGFHVLLIEWIGEVAYRVQAPLKSIAKGDWKATESQWKLVTLG